MGSLNCIDKKFLFSPNWKQKLRTSKGRFAIRKHNENTVGRGDKAASVSDKNKVMQAIGIRTKLAAPPWFVQVPESDPDQDR